MSISKKPSSKSSHSDNVLQFVKKPKSLKLSSGFASHGSFGKMTRSGEAVLNKSDRMEVALLAVLSERVGHYVFKRCCGAYGYLSENDEFIILG